MRQRFLGMLRCARCIFLFALGDRRVEVRDAFLGVRIGLRFLCGVGVRKRSLSVSHEHVSVAGLAVLDRFLRMFNGFSKMVFSESHAGAKNAARPSASTVTKILRVMLKFSLITDFLVMGSSSEG